MPDYRCPSCEGGFPADDHDDSCPWCGESMVSRSPEWTIPAGALRIEAERARAALEESTIGEPLSERLVEPLSDRSNPRGEMP